VKKALPYLLLVLVVLAVSAMKCDVDDPDGGRTDCQTGLATCDSSTSTPVPTRTPGPGQSGKTWDWGTW
jgi:hypothetical protein